MAMDLKQIFKLDNPIQNYAWGSRSMIASLVGAAEPADQPQAEMWMGAHPKSPSMVTVNGERISLADLIDAHPSAVLGADTARRFNRQMPFLFKVLAAAEPLSIQAHPNTSSWRLHRRTGTSEIVSNSRISIFG